MNLKVKKLPIIIPLVLVAVILLSVVISSRMGLDTAKSHTDLGRKHLEDGNYASATTEFLRSLSLDPTSKDARLGLAQVYYETDEPSSMEEVLQPLLDSGDGDAYRLLAESRRESDPAGALIAAQTLVNSTNAEEDFVLRDQLMALVMDEAHSFASGTDQTLLISGGKVLSRGSNSLGQLGVDASLGSTNVTDDFADAGFSGVPARVYCAGRTSLVLDAAGALWAAGDNRWGQMGVGNLSTASSSGWTRIADNAVAAAGTPGTLFVLKSDGTLWYSGHGGVAEAAPVTNLGMVCAIASTASRTAVLTVSGELYVSTAYQPLSFTRAAKDVKCFSLGDGCGLVWVTGGNLLSGEYGLPSMPQNWSWSEGGYLVDFTVADIAETSGELLLLGNDGQLRRLSSGSVTALDDDVVSIYHTGDGAVIEYADSTAALCLSGAIPTQLP